MNLRKFGEVALILGVGLVVATVISALLGGFHEGQVIALFGAAAVTFCGAVALGVAAEAEKEERLRGGR